MPNGNYDVTLTLGDLGSFAHDQVQVTIEEIDLDVVSTNAGETIDLHYPSITVNDGQFTLDLTDLGGSDPNFVIIGCLGD